MELLQAVAEANLDYVKHPNDIKKHEPAYIKSFDVSFLSAETKQENQKLMLNSMLHSYQEWHIRQCGTYSIECHRATRVNNLWQQIFTVTANRVPQLNISRCINRIHANSEINIVKIVYATSYSGSFFKNQLRDILRRKYNVSIKRNCFTIEGDDDTLKLYLGNEMIFVRLYIYTPSSRDIDEVLDKRMALIPRNLRYNRSEALICVNNDLAVITYGNGYFFSSAKECKRLVRGFVSIITIKEIPVYIPRVDSNGTEICLHGARYDKDRGFFFLRNEIYVKYPLKFKDLQSNNQHLRCGYVADKIIFD